MTADEKLDKVRRVGDPGEKRVETGPIKFDGDWPGFYLRGDDALRVSRLRETLEFLFTHYGVQFADRLQVLSDISVLGSVSECLLIDD